jgi:hypothetical protein
MLFGKKQEKHIEYDSDWLSNLVTTRENQFGDLINRRRTGALSLLTGYRKLLKVWKVSIPSNTWI